MLLVRDLNLSEEARHTLCVAINMNPDSEGRPFADLESVKYFSIDYAVRSIRDIASMLIQYDVPGSAELLTLVRN